jgi:hypothetical protein
MVQAWSMGSSKKCKITRLFMQNLIGPDIPEEKKVLPGPGAYSPAKDKVEKTLPKWV